MRLLIVDNDRDLVRMLADWLKTLGYEVRTAYTGERAQIEWERYQPDLVILDTALKDVDALVLCREMQSSHDAFVLATSSEKDVENEVRFLEAGADDYLLKPFFPAQLLARIHAVSRRVRSVLLQKPAGVLTVGPMRIDSTHHTVSVHGNTFRLTATESKLLHLLAVNANDICTAEQIISYLWGYGDVGDPSLIKAHIRHLRQKIEPDPNRPLYILTMARSLYISYAYRTERLIILYAFTTLLYGFVKVTREHITQFLIATN